VIERARLADRVRDMLADEARFSTGRIPATGRFIADIEKFSKHNNL